MLPVVDQLLLRAGAVPWAERAVLQPREEGPLWFLVEVTKTVDIANKGLPSFEVDALRPAADIAPLDGAKMLWVQDEHDEVEGGEQRVVSYEKGLPSPTALLVLGMNGAELLCPGVDGVESSVVEILVLSLPRSEDLNALQAEEVVARGLVI